MQRISKLFLGAAISAALLMTACTRTSSQDTRSPDEIAEAAIAAAKASTGIGEPVVWTLADEDTTLHIVGTVHLLRPGVEWQTEAITNALTSADTLVFEADVNSQDAAADMMQFIARKGMFTDGRQLTSLMDAEEQAELNTALESLDLPLGAVQTMRPWFAAINLSVLQIQKDGYDPNAGVENVLERIGHAQGKKFEYLETIDEQLGRLAGLPDDEQVAFLISSVESIEDGAKMLDILVDEWVDGDVDGLAILLSNPDIVGSEDVYDALLRSRNEDWVPKIKAMLDEPGTRLIAVGAGHLAGEDSVIKLLREDGLTVTGP